MNERSVILKIKKKKVGEIRVVVNHANQSILYVEMEREKEMRSVIIKMKIIRIDGEKCDVIKNVSQLKLNVEME
ncbi:hypothetical protein IKO18_05640 [bacterium]|jgi:hypothetical protein|nr:hypothetical protein [bacterium]